MPPRLPSPILRMDLKFHDHQQPPGGGPRRKSQSSSSLSLAPAVVAHIPRVHALLSDFESPQLTVVPPSTPQHPAPTYSTRGRSRAYGHVPAWVRTGHSNLSSACGRMPPPSPPTGTTMEITTARKRQGKVRQNSTPAQIYRSPSTLCHALSQGRSGALRECNSCLRMHHYTA